LNATVSYGGDAQFVFAPGFRLPRHATGQKMESGVENIRKTEWLCCTHIYNL